MPWFNGYASSTLWGTVPLLGGYGVGVYETDDYFFEPGSGEVQAVWWAEFNKVEEE